MADTNGKWGGDPKYLYTSPGMIDLLEGLFFFRAGLHEISGFLAGDQTMQMHGDENQRVVEKNSALFRLVISWLWEQYMGVSKIRGTPKWMVKIMENPIRMDDLGVPPFLETPI